MSSDDELLATADTMILWCMFPSEDCDNIRDVLKKHQSNFDLAFAELQDKIVNDSDTSSLSSTPANAPNSNVLDVPVRWEYKLLIPQTELFPEECTAEGFAARVLRGDFPSLENPTKPVENIAEHMLSKDEVRQEDERLAPYFSVFDASGVVHTGSFLADDALIKEFNSGQHNGVTKLLPIVLNQLKETTLRPTRFENDEVYWYQGPIRLRSASAFTNKCSVKIILKSNPSQGKNKSHPIVDKGKATPEKSKHTASAKDSTAWIRFSMSDVSFKIFPILYRFKKKTFPFFHSKGFVKVSVKGASIQMDVDANLGMGQSRVKFTNVKVDVGELKIRFQHSALSPWVNMYCVLARESIATALENHIVQVLENELTL